MPISWPGRMIGTSWGVFAPNIKHRVGMTLAKQEEAVSF